MTDLLTLESLPEGVPEYATMARPVAAMIRLQYKPTPSSRAWRNSYAMHVAGLENMDRERHALAKQEGWHETRIIRVPLMQAAS